MQQWLGVYAQRWQWHPREVDALTVHEFDAFVAIFEQMAADEEKQRRDMERQQAAARRR